MVRGDGGFLCDLEASTFGEPPQVITRNNPRTYLFKLGFTGVWGNLEVRYGFGGGFIYRRGYVTRPGQEGRDG